jgi:hypothetical protein
MLPLQALCRGMRSLSRLGLAVLDSFVLTIDSSGSMPAKDLVARASEEIKLREGGLKGGF